MFKLRNRDEETEVRFCERCESVCSPTCLAEASRQRAFDEMTRHGWWRPV